MYKISIIIPVFNVSEYLDLALESIINQTFGFENLEVIFVDDCSTDGSDLIIDSYAKKYDNVFSFKLDENSGIAGKPRNIGIEHATSEYLMFLDPDDVFTEDACEFLYNEITKKDVDIVSGVHAIETENGLEIHPGLWLNTLTNPRDNFQKRKSTINKLLTDNFNLKVNELEKYPSVIANFGMWTKIYKRSLIDKNNIRFPEYIPAEDSVFLYHSFLKANGIIFTNKIIVKYNNTRNDEENKSVSHKINYKTMMGRLKAYYIMLELSKENDFVEVFSQYLLLDKLSYFVTTQLLLSNCSTGILLDILEFSQPLFEICLSNNTVLNIGNATLFNHIANKRYEEALMFIKNKSSNVQKLPKQKDIKIAVIMDPFTHDSYKYEFNLIDLHPKNWLDTFKKEQPSLFICESAFSGVITDNNPWGVWRDKVLTNLTNDNENRLELKAILDYCNKNNIPTIFYNKEDPPSFFDPIYNFVDTALWFDYIFTSAEECIPKYNERGHDNVYSLMFASQPRMFNPIYTQRLSNTVTFAGTWYQKFPERCNLMNSTFDKILNKGLNLKIYDRFFNKNARGMEYPKKFKKYLNPGVDFSEMPNVYKGSDFGLNINTVTNSKTMFARRIFELMSSYTFVFSNFSKGIYSLFGNNVIYVDKDEINLDDIDVDSIKEENLYSVLKNHTYSNRFRQILDTIGFDYIPELMHVVLFYKNESNLDEIYNHFKSIKYEYKHIKIIDAESSIKDIVSEFDKENYYFCFPNLELSEDFIMKSILHYSYISNYFGISSNDDLKYSFGLENNTSNIIFNSKYLNEVLISQFSKNSREFPVYYI